MKKCLRAVVASVLVICVLLSTISVTSAAMSDGDEVRPMMEIIVYGSCQLIIPDGTATIDCSARGTPGSVDKVQLTVVLQRLVQSSWKTVNTYYATSYSNYASFNRQVSVLSGYSYRIKLTIKMWSGTATETQTMYSKAVAAN